MISRLNLKISIKNCRTFFFKHLLTKDKMCFWRRSSSVSHFRVFIEKSLSFECITILAALLCSLSRPSLSCLLHPAHTVSQYSNTGRICAWYITVLSLYQPYPVQGGGGVIITLELFGFQSSNCLAFPKIL